MNHTTVAAPVFQRGDEVKLIAGSYQGTLGVFVGLRSDVKWADVCEPNGEVRAHPVQWMGHAGLGRQNNADEQ
jgi:hypothetical protein